MPTPLVISGLFGHTKKVKTSYVYKQFLLLISFFLLFIFLTPSYFDQSYAACTIHDTNTACTSDEQCCKDNTTGICGPLAYGTAARYCVAKPPEGSKCSINDTNTPCTSSPQCCTGEGKTNGICEPEAYGSGGKRYCGETKPKNAKCSINDTKTECKEDWNCCTGEGKTNGACTQVGGGDTRKYCGAAKPKNAKCSINDTKTECKEDWNCCTGEGKTNGACLPAAYGSGGKRYCGETKPKGAKCTIKDTKTECKNDWDCCAGDEGGKTNGKCPPAAYGSGGKRFCGDAGKDCLSKDDSCKDSPVQCCGDMSCIQGKCTEGLPKPPPPPCVKLENGECSEVYTAFGKISTKPEEFIQKLFAILLSISGGVGLLLVMKSGYLIMTANGKPETIQQGRDQLVAALVGLIFLTFSFVILQVIGVDILKIPGLK